MQEVIGTNQMGKCPRCKVAFQWESGKTKLRDAYCPDCGKKIVATSSLLRQEFRLVSPKALRKVA